MWKLVKEYSLLWRNSTSRGEIQIFTDDGQSYVETTKTPAEFQVMADILRNENPVWYHTTSHYIICGREPAGEGEIHHSPFGINQ